MEKGLEEEEEKEEEEEEEMPLAGSAIAPHHRYYRWLSFSRNDMHTQRDPVKRGRSKLLARVPGKKKELQQDKLSLTTFTGATLT